MPREVRHAFNTYELFSGFNRKLKVKRSHWWKDQKLLAANIFNDCLYEILLDIINNNVTFVLPLSMGRYAEITTEEVSGEKFKELYKAGSFRNVDFVRSEFTAYGLLLRLETSRGVKKIPIQLDKDLRNLLDTHTNNGKKYF